jgi:hypothetical protein
MDYLTSTIAVPAWLVLAFLGGVLLMQWMANKSQSLRIRLGELTKEAVDRYHTTVIALLREMHSQGTGRCAGVVCRAEGSEHRAGA